MPAPGLCGPGISAYPSGGVEPNLYPVNDARFIRRNREVAVELIAVGDEIAMVAEVPARTIEAADGDRVAGGTAWIARALINGKSQPSLPATGKFPIATVNGSTR